MELQHMTNHMLQKPVYFFTVLVCSSPPGSYDVTMIRTSRTCVSMGTRGVILVFRWKIAGLVIFTKKSIFVPSTTLISILFLVDCEMLRSQLLSFHLQFLLLRYYWKIMHAVSIVGWDFICISNFTLFFLETMLECGERFSFNLQSYFDQHSYS